MPAIAKRLNLFSESVIRDMTRIAIQYNAINLSQGFPDFDPPSELVDAAKRAMEGGTTSMRSPGGRRTFARVWRASRVTGWGFPWTPTPISS